MGARTCSRCVNLRDADGYCSRRGEYRNALADALDGCFVDRSEAFDHIESVLKNGPEQKPVTKKCRGCGRELPLDRFPRHPKSRDGHTSVCAECYSKKMKAVHAKAEAAHPSEVLQAGQRRCSKCGRVLPVSEFARRSKSKDGLQYECRDCKKAAKVTSDKNVPLTLSEEPEPKYKPITVHDLTEEDLVAELRYRGWKVVCTKEL